RERRTAATDSGVSSDAGHPGAIDDVAARRSGAMLTRMCGSASWAPMAGSPVRRRARPGAASGRHAGAAGERLGDPLLEDVRREGLDDVVVHARLDGLDDAGLLGLGRDHDERGGLVLLAELLDEREPVHVGHVPVDQDQVGLEGVHLGQGVLSVARLLDLVVPELAQHGLLDVPHGLRVVDEHDAHGECSGLSSVGGQATLAACAGLRAVSVTRIATSIVSSPQSVTHGMQTHGMSVWRATEWSLPMMTLGQEIETLLPWNIDLAPPETMLTSSPIASAKSGETGACCSPQKRATSEEAGSDGKLRITLPAPAPDIPMMPETSCVGSLALFRRGSLTVTGSWSIV